jgi:hypothetical protein
MGTMETKAAVLQELNAYKGSVYQIIPDPGMPDLKKINDLFGAADAISLQCAARYRRQLWIMAFVGTLLTAFFLLYSEINLYVMILLCGAVLLVMQLLARQAKKSGCHKKYLQYRVLAETLRVQCFLRMSGTKRDAGELLPWPLRIGIPWLEDVLAEIPPRQASKQSVLDVWIRDQHAYHARALKRTEKKEGRDERVSRIVRLVTLTVYFAAVVLELSVFSHLAASDAVGIARGVLKFLLGTMSAVTLFTGTYYGRMSLSNVIDDHKRMLALYEHAEKEILEKGENEELLLSLARECLNENASWYAYQSKNEPTLAL